MQLVTRSISPIHSPLDLNYCLYKKNCTFIQGGGGTKTNYATAVIRVVGAKPIGPADVLVAEAYGLKMGFLMRE